MRRSTSWKIWASSCALLLVASRAFGAGAIVRDYDFSGPMPYTALAPTGIVSATWSYQTCFTCSTRQWLYYNPVWQSCVWRVVWNPLNASGGVRLNWFTEGTSVFNPIAIFTNLPAGVRTDTTDVTAAINARRGVNTGDDLTQQTQGNGVILYSSRIHCVSADVRLATPTPTATPAMTATPTPTRTPGGDFFCPRP